VLRCTTRALHGRPQPGPAAVGDEPDAKVSLQQSRSAQANFWRSFATREDPSTAARCGSTLSELPDGSTVIANAWLRKRTHGSPGAGRRRSRLNISCATLIKPKIKWGYNTRPKAQLSPCHFTQEVDHTLERAGGQSQTLRRRVSAATFRRRTRLCAANFNIEWSNRLTTVIAQRNMQPSGWSFLQQSNRRGHRADARCETKSIPPASLPLEPI
jgi:hypothetical protein